MRIGLDVAQTCIERNGYGWVADRVATAICDNCPDDEIILYHQFGGWLNLGTSEGTAIARPRVFAPFTDTSWLEARIIWERINAGLSNLPGDPDIVHSFSFQSPKVGTARLVYTIHDLSFWTHPEFTTEENRLSCQKGLLGALRHTSAFIYFSENSRNDFLSLLRVPDRVRALPSAIIPLASRFPSVAEARAAFVAGPWLSVGALEPRKNTDLLLDAFEIYRARSKAPRKLCMAGGKGWKSEGTWERIVDLERRGLLDHWGYVSDIELQRLYANAFGFLFPSHYEGFGLSILEAMSHACPVISSTNSSLPEVGGDAALYWDGKSAETFAESMLWLEQDSELYVRLSKDGLDRSRLFSWEKTARSLRQFYDQVI
ncbi:MAG TPA: glycosyltransferase family 1 protein [Chthoniobacterales bacterium]|jgi:glycosyltransferase involved in cell wall biosynthesis|nr:glycosyltransferase family 1 protein [Chthoniobacterales bacterium]